MGKILNKKAIELSLNFIVIIIISVIIFGFGVRFLYTLFSQANNLRDLTSADLDRKIGNLICDGSERICIGIDKKIIDRGKFDVFGVKILNIVNNENFDIKVSPSNPIGYKKNNDPISGPALIVNPEDRPLLTIKKNEDKTVGIGVEVPKNAVSGTYILNVDISNNNARYAPTLKLYVDVP